MGCLASKAASEGPPHQGPIHQGPSPEQLPPRSASQGSSESSSTASRPASGNDSQDGQKASFPGQQGEALHIYLPVAAQAAKAAYKAAKTVQRLYTFAWLKEGVCCFAFPGTYKPSDWEADLNFASTPWAMEDGTTVDIHKGFQQRLSSILALDSYKADMHKAMQAHTCLCTGHSLGGAVACLAALHCKAQRQQHDPAPPRVQCITFGAPLIGGLKLQKHVKLQGWQCDFLHVVSRHDIVPRILISKSEGLIMACKAAFSHASTPILMYDRDVEDDANKANIWDLGQQVKDFFEPIAMAPRAAAKAVVAACQTHGAYRPVGTYLLCAHGGLVPLEKPEEVLHVLYVTMTLAADPFTTGRTVLMEHKMSHYRALVDVQMPAAGHILAGTAIMEARSPFEYFVAKELQAYAGTAASSASTMIKVQETLAEVRGILDLVHTQHMGRASAEMPRVTPMFAQRLAERMIGREQELHAVCEALRQYSSVVIVGGPGEGKSTLANEAAKRMYEWGSCPAGIFYVDLQGLQRGEDSTLETLLTQQFGAQLQSCQGGLDQSLEVSFSSLLHWLRCLPTSHAVILVIESAEDALCDSNGSQELQRIL
ncbi:hypothetical protein WJX73_010756 [Symbiochloris irregularis]|uniref:Fungal lipase-type domain-containing protein n=1 Tax=Symbiochloris irregularis TaxID=706552 RepID=A0AAW1PJB8_9CHLO